MLLKKLFIIVTNLSKSILLCNLFGGRDWLCWLQSGMAAELHIRFLVQRGRAFWILGPIR